MPSSISPRRGVTTGPYVRWTIDIPNLWGSVLYSGGYTDMVWEIFEYGMPATLPNRIASDTAPGVWGIDITDVVWGVNGFGDPKKVKFTYNITPPGNAQFPGSYTLRFWTSPLRSFPGGPIIGYEYMDTLVYCQFAPRVDVDVNPDSLIFPNLNPQNVTVTLTSRDDYAGSVRATVMDDTKTSVLDYTGSVVLVANGSDSVVYPAQAFNGVRWFLADLPVPNIGLHDDLLGSISGGTGDDVTPPPIMEPPTVSTDGDGDYICQGNEITVYRGTVEDI